MPPENIRKPHKMVKHTQMFDYFVRFSDVFKGYKKEHWPEMVFQIVIL